VPIWRSAQPAAARISSESSLGERVGEGVDRAGVANESERTGGGMGAHEVLGVPLGIELIRERLDRLRGADLAESLEHGLLELRVRVLRDELDERLDRLFGRHLAEDADRELIALLGAAE